MRRLLPLLAAALPLVGLATGSIIAADGPGPAVEEVPGSLSPLGEAHPATSSVEDREVERLGGELLELLERYRWRSATWGVLVTSLDHGDTLFAWNPDSALAPASNLKLLTSAAAFHRLRPEFRFRTYLLSDGIVEDGVLHGDLVLYGTGDPGISSRFYPSRTFVFEELVRQLDAAGVRAIRGDVVADASFLPGPLRPPGWDPDDLDDHFAPAVSALSFNENVVTFRLEPGAEVGAPPVVHTIPDHAGLTVENRGVTVAGAARPRIAVTRSHPIAPFEIDGEIRHGGRDVWRQTTVPVPAHFAGSAFRAVLAEAGVPVSGRVRVVDEPGASLLGGPTVSAPAVEGRPRVRLLARHTSPPLRQYLAVVNKRSNNLFAELVFRVLGRDRAGTGSAEEGARAVREALDELGVDAPNLRQLDGSGLSEGNRVTPGTLVRLLEREAGTPLWTDFWETLPEAGRRRELPRMYRTAAAGNLRAKTGTIARVSGLTGVVHSAQGERLAFSILVNGTPSTSRAKSVENRIGARLASFQRSVPLPARTAQLPPPLPSREEGGITRHRVERGENLTLIARRYGLPLRALVEANPGIEPERIRAGSVILVPPALERGRPGGDGGGG
jgi:D-alanyl-D-alanine carboxypeptidase/D-alanyl-D-alanine-endopeptidase (penicillin-binding protein 4)